MDVCGLLALLFTEEQTDAEGARLNKHGDQMARRAEESMSSQNVSFSAKELFLEINRKLDGLSTQINQKADKGDLDKIEASVVELQRLGGDAAQQALAIATKVESRVITLEAEKATTRAVKKNEDELEKEHKNSQWQWAGIAASIVLGVLSILAQWYRGH